MPGPSLGEAVVEVTADMSGFEKSLQAGLKGADPTVTKSGNDLGSSLGDAIADTASDEVKKKAKDIPAPVKKAVDDTLKDVAKTTQTRFGSLGKTIGTELGKVGKAAGVSLGQPIVNAAAKVRTQVTKSLSSLGGTVKKALAPIGSFASKAFSTVASAAGTVRDKVSGAFTAVRTKIGTVLGGIGGVASKAFTPIRTAASKIGTGVTTAFSKVSTGASTVFSKVSSAASTAFTGVTTAASRIASPIRKVMDSTLGKQVASSFGKVKTAAGQAFGSLGPLAQKAFPAIGGVASKVFGKIGGFASKATGAIGTAFSKIKGPVTNVLSGLGSAASTAFSKIGSIASSAMATAVKAVKGVAIAGAAGIAAGAGVVISKGFSRLTGIENATASLKGLGYEAKEATDIINGPVMEAVSGTAFGLAEAAQAAQGALGAGVKNGDQLADYLTLVGDAAAQAQIDFGSMALMMNKVQGAGKLTGDVMQQMAENGLPVGPMLADALGKPIAQVQTMVSEGKISAEQFQKILKENIGGAAQEMGNTTMGAFKNMGAAAGRLGAKFLTGSFPYFKKFFKGVTDLLDSVGPKAEKLGASLGKFLKPAMDAFTDFTKQVKSGDLGNIASLFNPLMTVAKQLLPVLSAIGSTFKGVIGDQVKNIGEALKGIDPAPITEALTNIGNAVTIVIHAFGKIDLGKIIGPLATAFVSLAGAVAQIMPPIMTLVSTLGGALGQVLPIVADGIATIAQTLGGALGQVLTAIMPSIGALVEALSGALAQVLPVIVTLVHTLASALGGILAAALPPLIDVITVVVNILGDLLKAILPALIPIITMLGQVFGQMAGIIGDVLAKVLDVLVTTLLPVLIDYFNTMAPIIGQLVSAILPPLMQLFAALVPILVPLVQLLANLVAAVLPILVKVLQFLLPILTKIIEVFAQVVTWVAKMITKFTAWITSVSSIGEAFSDVVGVIVDAAQWLWDKLFGHSIFPDMLNAMTGWVKNIGAVFGKMWGHVKDTFNKIKNWVSGTWKNAWGKVSGFMSGAVAKGRDKIANLWGSTKEKFSNARKWTASTWRQSWSKVSEWMSGAVAKGRDRIGSLWEKTKDKFSAARKWTGNTWRNSWSKVSEWMSNAVGKGRDKIGTFWQGTKDRFSNARKWTRDTWAKGWANVKSWIADPVGSAKNLLAKHRENIRKGLNALDDFGRHVFGKRWAGMKEVLAKPVRGALDWFRGALGSGGTLRTLFSNFVAATAKIMDGLKAAFGAPVKWVVNNAIIPLATAAHNIGSKVDIDIPIPKPMKFAKGGIANADTSGIFPGYTPGRDIGIAAVSGGEPIMRPEFGRAVGHDWVHAANAAARTGGVQGAKKFLAEQQYGRYMGAFAGGGTVQPVPGHGNRHTSGYSWATWAGDFPIPMNTPVKAWKDGIVAAVKHLTTSYGKHIRLNHDDGSSSLYAHLNKTLVSVGDKISAGATIGLSDSTGNSTGPHLHFETMGKPYNGGSGATGDTESAGFLSKIKELMTVTLPGRFGKNTWTDMLTAIPETLGQAALDKLKGLVSAIGDGVMSGISWVGSKLAGLNSEQRDNAAKIIDVAHQLGFGDRGAIIGLITGLVESGLRNLSWGDRDSVGVFQQRAPWGSFADRTNVSKSASMFFNGGQGGQPGLRDKNWRSGGLGALAQAVQVSAFPGRYSLQVPRAKLILEAFKAGSKKYDNGGWLPTGYSVAYNGTGRGENKAVFTEDQWQILHDLASSRTSSGTHIKPGDRVVFEIEGEPMTAIAKKVMADETRRALVRN